MRSQTASNHTARRRSAVATASPGTGRKLPRADITGPQQLLDFQRSGFADAGAEAGRAPRPSGREAAAPLYLSSGHCCGESNSKEIEPSYDRTVWKLVPCMCRKWYCGNCAEGMGRSLRRRLCERLKQFKRVFGVTLTIDGSLFDSPEEAWRYVMDNRLLSVLVKKLSDRGYLNSRAYFWVVEWQEETQQAHWHLLIDSEFIPFGVLVEIWSSFRPKSAPRLERRVTAENYKELARPAFGSVQFSLSSKNAWTAANYATKYLVKVPKYGFPDWVLNYVGRVPRYGRSRGFFPSEKKTHASGKRIANRDIEFAPHELEAQLRLRDRIAKCKSRTTLFRVTESLDSDGTWFVKECTFVRTYDIPFAEICERYSVVRSDVRSVYIDEWDLEDFSWSTPIYARNGPRRLGVADGEVLTFLGMEVS